jgi:hypothetical protein
MSLSREYYAEAYRQWHRETAERFRAKETKLRAAGMIGAADIAARCAHKHEAKANAGPPEAYLRGLA